MESKYIISAAGIHKSFGEIEVLRGVDISVKQGEIVSIVGKSGAGKTTLLQIIGTLERPNAGQVMIDGTDVWSLGEKQLSEFRNRNIGFIFQFHQLLPEFTAIENVMMPALIGGWGYDKAKQRAETLLCELGLTQRLEHKPNTLSGGEKQRAAAARALMMQPKVILADEPTGSLDENNKKELSKLLEQIRRDFGQTIVIVTHDKELAAISDRIIEMRDGMIISSES